MAFRDLFWRQITAAVVRQTNVIQPHRAPSEDDYVRPMPMGRRYPGLGDIPVYMSENTPKSEEADEFTLIALHEVLHWKETYPLATAFNEPYTEEGVPYPHEYEKLAPTPKRPEDFLPGADRLAGIARRGPFSMYTKPDGQGGYFLDFSSLEALEPRAPFIRVGGIARFKRKEDRTLETVSIEFQGKTLTRESAEWSLAEKRILAAINSYSTFVDHLTHVHLLGAGTWTVCTHLALPAHHPLRILMQPFIIETMRVNNDNIDGLIKSDHSNVPNYTGYSLAALNEVMRAAVAKFDVRWFDAELRAAGAGQLDDPAFPTMESAVTLWRIYRKFVDGWVKQHLPTVDLETRIWCQELHARVPNGVSQLLGIKDFETELTLEHVAHLATMGIFTASVWHHVVANMGREYEMQFDVMPPALDKDGHTTLGIVYEKRNSITIAGLLRYKLIDDTVYLPQDSMKQLWQSFQSELKAYEAGLDQDPAGKFYRVVPSQVPSSVHA